MTTPEQRLQVMVRSPSTPAQNGLSRFATQLPPALASQRDNYQTVTTDFTGNLPVSLVPFATYLSFAPILAYSTGRGLAQEGHPAK
jgi:hypothetical protein